MWCATFCRLDALVRPPVAVDEVDNLLPLVETGNSEKPLRPAGGGANDTPKRRRLKGLDHGCPGRHFLHAYAPPLLGGNSGGRLGIVPNPVPHLTRARPHPATGQTRPDSFGFQVQFRNGNDFGRFRLRVESRCVQAQWTTWEGPSPFGIKNGAVGLALGRGRGVPPRQALGCSESRTRLGLPPLRKGCTKRPSRPDITNRICGFHSAPGGVCGLWVGVLCGVQAATSYPGRWSSADMVWGMGWCAGPVRFTVRVRVRVSVT